MKKEMLINVLQSEECRIAIVEDGVLEELYVERTSHESYVGNIYKGRIVNIEPSIQAAFVDFGVGRNGFLQQGAIAEFARKQISEFDIRCQGPDVRTGTLSGGNLQKALLARELAFNPKALIVSQPTRGLDVGAARFVYDRFLALRATDCGLLVISEDLEELLTLSDRIAVLYEGEIVGLVKDTSGAVRVPAEYSAVHVE
jgi:Rne/Rng family ribonuclease